jgi:hypothetical protein
MSMPGESAGGGRRRAVASAAVVLALYLLLQTAGPAVGSFPLDQAAARPAQPALVLASDWGPGHLWHRGEVFLSDRRHMIQLATLGMCLGLYILMRR